jgi:hypothetical protein
MLTSTMKMKSLLVAVFISGVLSAVSGCGTDHVTSTSETTNPVSSNRGGRTLQNDSEKPPGTANRSETDSPPRLSASANAQLHEMSFDDLNCGLQADVVFRPWMLTERVQQLDGRRVQITGYMLPDVKQKGITEFILLRNTECKFGPGGQPDHLVWVRMKSGATASYSNNPVEVVGILKVNPYTGPDGNTWSLFDMAGETVKARRR